MNKEFPVLYGDLFIFDAVILGETENRWDQPDNRILNRLKLTDPLRQSPGLKCGHLAPVGYSPRIALFDVDRLYRVFRISRVIRIFRNDRDNDRH